MAPETSWACFILGGGLIAWAVVDGVRAWFRGDPNPALAVLEAERAATDGWDGMLIPEPPLLQPAKTEVSVAVEQIGPDDWQVTVVDDDGVTVVGGLPADEARIFAESWVRL